jgi:hypothetical protein
MHRDVPLSAASAMSLCPGAALEEPIARRNVILRPKAEESYPANTGTVTGTVRSFASLRMTLAVGFILQLTLSQRVPMPDGRIAADFGHSRTGCSRT